MLIKGYRLLLVSTVLLQEKIRMVRHIAKTEEMSLFQQSVNMHYPWYVSCALGYQEIYSRASNTIVHSTEAANYKKFEQQALESETYRPASKSTTLTYTGSIGYSGWTPSTVTAEGDVDFSVTNQGGTFMISDVNWSDYTNPKITMIMQGATGNVTCRFAKTASGRKSVLSVDRRF